LAKTPRGWTGARTPSAIKRVRQAQRRRAIDQPRRSAAKTFVANAVKVAAEGSQTETAAALAEAMSALDRAARVGAIHPNNAARRKSRLALKLNAMAEGTTVAQPGHATRTTGTGAAVKAARTRIATAKATKAKGPQTAAGKAKAALSKTARSEAVAAPSEPAAKPKAAPKAMAKPAGTSKAAVAKGAAPKPAPKAAAPKPAAKPEPAKAAPSAKSASKPAGTKPAAKAPAKAATEKAPKK